MLKAVGYYICIVAGILRIRYMYVVREQPILTSTLILSPTYIISKAATP